MMMVMMMMTPNAISHDYGYAYYVDHIELCSENEWKRINEQQVSSDTSSWQAGVSLVLLCGHYFLPTARFERCLWVSIIS